MKKMSLTVHFAEFSVTQPNLQTCQKSVLLIIQVGKHSNSEKEDCMLLKTNYCI